MLPDPDHLWAHVVEAQVRRTQTMLKEAKLANLPIDLELMAEKPVALKKNEKRTPPETIQGCKTFETFVAFQASPAEAVRKAKLGGKLVLMLHLAGNIEDDGFT